jgi:hypothetical protein
MSRIHIQLSKIILGVQESELENGDRSPERKCLRSLQSLQLVRARVKYAKIRNTEVRVHCEEGGGDGEQGCGCRRAEYALRQQRKPDGLPAWAVR